MAKEKTAYDPGWNDPPTFSYDKANEIQSIANKKGTVLNKRVPFPLAGGARLPSGGTDPTLPPSSSNKGLPPPLISSASPLLPPSVPCLEISHSLASDNSNETNNDRLQEVLANIRNVHNLHDGDEITKRVRIMEKMWSEGKLLLPVQSKILQLTKALRDGEMDNADHIQKSLMVDHIAACSSWMGGFRQLINQLRSNTTTDPIPEDI